MSAKEKQVAQIFERTKWIIEQARRQCLLWEHHLSPKLILHGILPPPWLSNNSHPKELNKDEIVSEVLFSQPQFGVPFSARHCRLYSNLGVVSEDLLCPSGLQNEAHALRKDCNTGDGLSNLPDCSVNNDGCASSGPPELDSGAVSPQNQIEPRVSDSYYDPALSLAKLQRSKPRQRALELRNSAKEPKRCSGDDNNAGICAGTVTGSKSSTLQAGHIEEPDLVKDFHSNIQGCSAEEMRRGDCQTQTNDKCNYSGRITRSRSLAQKLNSSNAANSSVVKEDGPPSNNSNEPLELVNGPLFSNESCEVEEANKGEHQRKEAGSSAYHKRTTKSSSCRQSRYSSEILKLDGTTGGGKGVEIHDFMQPFAPVDLTGLSKASDQNNGTRRNTLEDSDFCKNKEGNSHGRIGSLRNSSPSPVDDFLMTGDCVNSIDKSGQSPQPLISQHSQNRLVSVVGSFHNQKDPDFCAVKAKERLSRGGIGKVYITTDSKSQNHIEEISKSLSSNFCEQSATCSEFAGKRSQNVRLAELDARRLSSTRTDSKLDTEIPMNSTEKENIAASASRNTRAVTTCAAEGSLRPVSASNLDGGSLLGKSLYSETAAADKVLDGQENILCGANPTDNIDRLTATVAKVEADLDGLVGKDPSGLGCRVTSVSPMVGMDVTALRMPSDVVMSVMPKQLDFDDIEVSSMNGISSPGMKEGQQGMSPEEEPLNLLKPVNVLEDETSLECQVKCNSSGEMRPLETEEALVREEGPQTEYCACQFEEADVARKAINVMSPNRELPVAQKELCILTSSLMIHSSPSQVDGENSSESLSKEVMASKFVSVSRENDESSAKLGDALSAAVTGTGLHKYTDETVSNFTVGFSSGALIDEVNVEAPISISFCQNVDLLRQKWLSDGKNTGFSADFEIFNSSKESFGHDMKRSCSQHKRRKINIETGKFLPAASNFLEKPFDSIDQRSLSRGLNIEDDNPKALQEDQHLTSDQEHDIGRPYVSNSPMEEMQGTQQCETMDGSSLRVRKKEKLIADGRGGSADNLLLEDEKVDSWHHQVDDGQESAQRLTCVEKSNSNGRIYPRGNAKFSGGSSAPRGIQCVDLIGTDDTVPEFEGFIMPTDRTQPCTTGDQMELEKMNLPSNPVDYTSLGKSRFMHSPLCYSSTPYKLHTIPDLYQSLPNGLLEGMNLRTSLPLNDRSTRSLSDCLPNRNVQYTPSVQTLWDRINSNFGSSGKRQSLKLELPCISEENENVDEIADTLQKGNGSEGMTSSITREPLAEIIDNVNPSASALQDDILNEGSIDVVNRGFNFSRTQNKVKKKLDKQDGNRRRFTNKGKENQSTSLGANGAKRTTESVCNRPSRPKLSGKDSLKQQGSTFSVGKFSYNNIVSNIASFVPLVQQKQAAAVVTGKRDIKVKALEAAEAAKRMAEKKENERKMKKEALRLERERLEQKNLRQLELQKKKKEEERKKKEAEMAAKKRQREEEEKKEKGRKRKRVNDAKKQQQEHEKIYSKKEETQTQSRAAGEEVQESKKFMDERENHQNLQPQDIGEGSVEEIFNTESLNTRDSTNDKTKESCPAYLEAVSDSANKVKVMCNLIKAAEDNELINESSLQEQSYEISPYKGSDDEDEDEDDIPNNKFIPSWASKHRLSLAVSSQKMDPETIFPPQSFCNIAEVLLPRKLQLK